MASVTRFLESRLRLRVNQQKSAVAPVGERKFLGYRLGADGTLGIAPKSLARTTGAPASDTRTQPGGQPGADDRRAQCLSDRMGDVLPSCTGAQRAARPGWLAAPQAALRAAPKHCKQPAGLRRIPLSIRGSPRPARELASSGRGWWCLANSLQAKIAMNITWFDQLGLINLTARHAALNAQGNRRGTWSVRPVV